MAENAGKTQGSEIVRDRGATKLSDLWTKEDYWAIWLGFILIIVGMLIYLPRPPKDMHEKIDKANATLAAEAAKGPFRTIEWYKASDSKGGIRASREPHGQTIASWMKKPAGWVSNPIDSLVVTKEHADAKNAAAKAGYEKAKKKMDDTLAAATAGQAAAAAAGFKDEKLNEAAKDAIGEWRAARRGESSAKGKTSNKPFNIIPSLIGLCVVLGLFFSIGIKFMGKSVGKFLVAFPFVFLLATLAFMGGEQSTMKYYGFGDPLWAIAIGLLISNTIGTPKWVQPAVQTEYYIKTGLVLLGAEILFSKIVQIGIPGIFVAWVVTPIVLIVTYIFGQTVVKMPSKTLNITISADMSVCGVSAAIATAAACRAKKEELTLAVGLSLVFTAIMMVVMPIFIKAVGMPHVLGGAWMGGTIDSTGAVAAAGAFLSDKALYVAATIKMIQNVLIGVTAFGVAVYWCAKVDCVAGEKVSPMEIWHRFPKFVLGFLAASIVFSLLYEAIGSDVGNALVDHGVTRGFTGHFRGWFFCLAFASIGLATDFRELAHYFKGGKPVILYVCGQSFNLALTLFMAWIMFYVVFPEITAGI